MFSPSPVLAPRLKPMLVAAILASISASAYENPTYPAPTIDQGNLDQWMQFVEPTPEELSWREMRWHKSLAPAVAEAKRLNRPILLWTMNGHPCGET